MLRKLLRFTAFITFPLMLGLSLVAKEFIVILITEKWLVSAGILQILCVAGAFIPISALFSNLIISRGHSKAYMWTSVAQCVAGIVVAMAASPFGIHVMVMAFVAVTILWTGVWLWLARREVSITAYEFLRDISPYLLLSVALCLIAHFACGGIGNIYLRFGAKVLVVAIPYVGVLWLLGSTILRESADFLIHKKIS